MFCLDCRYVERPLFQYCEMYTDSAYIALAGDSIDNLVTSEHREHFFRHRSEWLLTECCDKHKYDYVQTRLAGLPWTATEACCVARKAYDKRTPGLFKIELCGDGFIGLCSKTYYCFGATDKSITKGLNKRQNIIDKDAFLNVLTNRRSGGGFNRGFRVRDSSVMTYCAHLLLSEAESPRRRTEHGAPGPVILRRVLLLLVLHTVSGLSRNEPVHEEEPPFRHVRHLPRTESVFEKQGEPHHQFECAVHDRVQKPARRVSARKLGQINVPRSRRIRPGGVHRCDSLALRLSSDRPKTEHARRYASAHVRTAGRCIPVGLRTEVVCVVPKGVNLLSTGVSY